MKLMASGVEILMRVWVEHVYYNRNRAGWVSGGKIWREMPGGERIYRK